MHKSFPSESLIPKPGNTVSFFSAYAMELGYLSSQRVFGSKERKNASFTLSSVRFFIWRQGKKMLWSLGHMPGLRDHEAVSASGYPKTKALCTQLLLGKQDSTEQPDYGCFARITSVRMRPTEDRRSSFLLKY